MSSSAKTVQYGVIVRNICNSTLSLLFTTALFIWGFVVNRKRAWRTDGGTAAFGAGALLLAVGSTAVNFLEVKVDRLSWLQHLLLSIILWQSWLGQSASWLLAPLAYPQCSPPRPGWWWWVGSGMGIGEVEDMMEKEHKRARKAARRLRKAEARSERASSVLAAAAASGSTNGSSTGGRWTGITSQLSTRRRSHRRENSQGTFCESPIELRSMADRTDDERDDDVHSLSGTTGPPSAGGRPQHRRSFSASQTTPDGERERVITLPHPVTTPQRTPTNVLASLSSPPPRASAARHQSHVSTTTTTASSSSSSESTQTGTTPTSLHMPKTLGSFLAFPATVANYYISSLGRAHDEAAKTKARERAARAAKREERERTGWGLGSYGVREAAEGKGRILEVQSQMREGRLLEREADWVDEDDDEEQDEDRAARRAGRRGRQAADGPSSSGRARRAAEVTAERRRSGRHVGFSSGEDGEGGTGGHRSSGREEVSPAATAGTGGRRRRRPPDSDEEGGNEGARGSGWTLLGPLREFFNSA